MTQIKSIKNLSEADILEFDSLQNSIGRIRNPLLHIPLKNSLDMICGDGSVTFTRSTTATYLDRYGVIQTSAINSPRFEKEGLLIEGSSTNSFLYSEQFDNSAWAVGANITRTANDTTAPDGNTTADKIATVTTSGYTYVRQPFTLTSGHTYCVSVFAKKGNHRYIGIRCANSTGTHLTFDFDTETFSHTSLFNSWGYKKLADGWYRIWGVRTSDMTGTQYNGIALVDSNGAENATWSGGEYVYIWGAQLEELPFASSYIPTTTAAVTRTNERCYIQRNGNIPSLKYGESTVLCDVNLNGISGNQQFFRDIWAWKYAIILVANGDYLRFVGSESLDVYDLTFKSNTDYRFGGVENSKTLEQKLYMDGDLVGSRTESLIDDVVNTTVDIGSNHGSYYHIFGHISNFRIYDVALSDDEMRIA